MDDSRLLQEFNLTARQPHHVIQAITSDGLAQGPYVMARVGSNLRPCGRKALNLLLSHHAPCCLSGSYQLSHLYQPRNTIATMVTELYHSANVWNRLDFQDFDLALQLAEVDLF